MLKTPPLQSATATIETLCGRLSSATLLEDRRAAILGLRSFAKQYPASVASGSLRELITILRRDGLGEALRSKDKDEDENGAEEGGDVDTIRLVMETLLMLFNPDSNSPEAGDEIAFFLADEFSMRQDNISLLLNLLDPTSPYADYYSRLYSVQILTAICAARPERLQECVLNVPLGTSRVVGVLDDARDAVRNAGLLLLVDLTGGANEDLRKIVAFEDVFGKVFALIRMEGGLADAGIAGQDCLSLLANLIRGSASNQTMFRESGCVGHFAHLMREIFPPEVPEAPFIAESREKAGWGVLQLLRLFLARGESSTIQNQAAFFKAGTAQSLLDMSFHPGLPIPVRVAALKTTADLISNNAPIQEQFAALQIVLPSDSDTASSVGSQTNGSRSNTASARNSARPSVEKKRTYVIEALLDSTLDQPRVEASLRAAACALIQAYLAKHDRIKHHFLQRAIGGYEQGEDAANVVTALLQPGADTLGVLFASWIVQDLITDEHEAKKALAAVKEGNESEGEEVLTAVQALGSQLENAMQTGADERVIVSYASTLTIFLWEFADGINDLLAEGSGLVQALVASVSSLATPPVIAGLSASLLGTVYEFSTKDSPISRRTLAPLLTQKMGRGKYLDALLALRRDPSVRDFGVDEPDGESVFVNETFVDLFQTEYPRLRKAIDKDPGVEVLPFGDVDAGVDRDILDDLRQQVQTAKDALSQSQQDAQQTGQQAEHDKLSLQKEYQTASAELERLRKINEAMQKGHEEETTKLQSQRQREKENMNVEHSRAIANVRQEADRQARQAREQQEQSFASRVKDYERKLTELSNAHKAEQSGHSAAKQQADAMRQQLDSMRQQNSDLTLREQGSARKLQDLSKTHQGLERAHQQAQDRLGQAESSLEQARKQLAERDAEIAALQSQLAELKEEIKSKEQELASGRESFAGLEKELEAAKAAAEAKAAGDSEAAAKAEKLEALSKNLTGKVKELQDEVKAAKEAKELAEKNLAENEQKSREALEKAKLAKEAAEKNVQEAEKRAKEASEKSLKDAEKKVQDAEKKAKEASEKSLKEAEKKVQDAEKRAKDAQEKAKKAGEDNSGGSKKKGNQQVSKKEADEAAKSAQAAKKELEATQKEVESARTELEASKNEVESAKKELENAKEEAEAAKKEVEAANKAAETAKAAEKEAREELENMVLVIEDIEKKRDEYKEKVKELGGEVSEDEDDDEDEDEDEDDDE